MRFGCEMNDPIEMITSVKAVKQPPIRYISLNKIVLKIRIQPVQVVQGSGIRKLVEIYYVPIRPL